MVYLNDIVLRGYLLSINKGSEAERLAIGLRWVVELKTAVEGFQMTPQGLRKLEAAQRIPAVGRAGGWRPPAAVAVATATRLASSSVAG